MITDRIYKAKQQQQKTGNPFPANPGATITFIEHKSKKKAAALKYTRYPIRFDLQMPEPNETQ